MNKYNLVSWNILAPTLAKEEWFPYSIKEDLDPHIRLEKTLKILDTFVYENKIICLQEVGRSWLSAIEMFFLQNDYLFFTAPYEDEESDYMGVAIAYPKSLKTINVIRTRIGSRIEELKNDSPIYKFFSYFPFIYNLFKSKKVRDNEIARACENVMLSVILVQDLNKKICISTYHAPCKYWLPEVMSDHLITSFKVTEEIAESYNAVPIIGGDFNIKAYGFEYLNSLKTHFRSAHYLWRNNSEISFTTNTGLFKETLDYFWIREKDWYINNVDVLYSQNLTVPNIDHPSDHFAIAFEGSTK